jgi:integrase
MRLAFASITVVRGWDDKEGPIEPKSVKGRRVVPVVTVLRRFLLEQKMRTGRDGDALLFGRTPSEPFTPTHVRARALKAWGEAGLDPLGLHEARHTYVSLMHTAGVPLERIGDYVGHSSTYMTDRYRHLIEGERERDADRLDAFLTGAQTGASGG